MRVFVPEALINWNPPSSAIRANKEWWRFTIFFIVPRSVAIKACPGRRVYCRIKFYWFKIGVSDFRCFKSIRVPWEIVFSSGGIFLYSTSPLFLSPLVEAVISSVGSTGRIQGIEVTKDIRGTGSSPGASTSSFSDIVFGIRAARLRTFLVLRVAPVDGEGPAAGTGA